MNNSIFESKESANKSDHFTAIPTEFDTSNNSVKSRIWLENSPVCTKIIDLDFNLHYMSQAGITALKIDDVNEYYGKGYPFHFFPEWSKKSMLENLERVKKNGETIIVETTAFDLEGTELWFRSSLSPIFKKDDSLDYIMVVSSDITQRKHAEERIKTKNAEIIEQNKRFEKLNKELIETNAMLLIAKDQAEESEKLKTAFLANMSHEIRTPLNSILGFTDILKSNKLIPENEKFEYLNYIESGGNRLLRIISDIVDISKLEANQMSIYYEEQDLNKLIDNLQNQLSIQLKNKPVPLFSSKALADNDCIVNIDGVRLSQVLSNLIENAGIATQNGRIDFGYDIEGQFLRFFVKDTGIGIDEKEHKSIFERFRQVEDIQSKDGSGTGLGLPIAEELVSLMGGEIWLESQKGKGATFYFTIPYQKVESQKTVDSISNNYLVKNSNKTILIAEDENLNYLYLKTILKEYGFRVIRANDGQKAVDIVRNEQIDLVLMDTRMPKLNGHAATIEIRKTNKTLPIIAQSAYAMTEDKKKALNAGLNAYLTKPISRMKLDEILKEHLNIEV